MAIGWGGDEEPLPIPVPTKISIHVPVPIPANEDKVIHIPISMGQLCNDTRAREAVLADMDSVGKKAQLRGFEFVKSVTSVLEAFTMENGLLTPTHKIKRPQAKAYFAKAISDMYAQLSTSDPAPKKKVVKSSL